MCLGIGHALGKSLAEIGEMDLDELALWDTWLDEYDPQQRDDWRMAVLASTIVNSRMAWQGDASPHDFMPAKAIEVDGDDSRVEKEVIAWCASVGGRVRRGGTERS